MAAHIRELERTIESQKDAFTKCTDHAPRGCKSHANRIQKPQEDPKIKANNDMTLTVEEQWNLCVVERRKKYEQYQMGLKAAEYQIEQNIPKTKKRKKQKEEITKSHKSVKNVNKNDESETKDHNKVLQSAETVASNPEAVPEETQKKVTQKWKKGTVLITGDSMLTGIDERRMQTRNNVKLRPFSGASTEDMRSYLKPLMNKEPSVVILHAGTKRCYRRWHRLRCNCFKNPEP